jgi:uncharacterized protein
MNSYRKLFAVPVLISAIVLLAVYLWGGWPALGIALLLTVLEVTLSFDNAVVNAKVLKQMDEKWRHRFMTWGILIAVFATRFVLPILIVAASVALSPLAVAKLALFSPEQYGALLHDAHTLIASFGGAFLLMVSLKYFFDESKESHWIQFIERHVARWGRIEAVEIGVALSALLVLAFFAHDHAAEILSAGILGIVLFIFMQGITSSVSVERGHAVAAGGFALFMYLEVLDASFSLDGVVAAFALTNLVPVIAAGLGIGALFVRTLTIAMVERNTLDAFAYLEHGAHWAILGLSASMLASLFIEVPEAVTALAGILIIGASVASSVLERKVAES